MKGGATKINMIKKEKNIKQAKVENENLCGALSYLFIGIIWYFADDKMKQSAFAKYHAKQGIVLLIADLIFWAIAMAPFIGWAIGWILNVGIIILMVIGIVNGLNGQTKPLPLIGQFAENFNF